MIQYEESFPLSDENLVVISQKCGELYEKMIRKSRQYPPNRFILEIEELLRHMQKAYGADKTCVLRCHRTLLSVRVEFLVSGSSIDPLTIKREDLIYSRQILNRYGAAPAYNYSRNLNQNIVSVEMLQKPVKNKMMLSIFTALTLAIVTRLLLGLLPSETMLFIKSGVVSPIFNKMTTIISEVATFLVFLSVVTGISGVGSSAALGRIGKKLIASAGLTYLISGVSFSVISCLLYPPVSSGSSGSNVIQQLLQLILDIIPDNLVQCFATDNDLQVIVLSIFVGVILLIMGKRVSRLNEALVTLSDVVNKMMTVICKFLPCIVFFGILNMLLGDVSEVISVYKVAIIFPGTALVIIAFLFLRVRIATGLHASRLFRLQWPTTLINLTTSSQVGALPENMKCCKEKFGIDSSFVDFALPLCLVAYMPCGVGFLGGAIYGLAGLSGVPIDFSFVIKLAFMAVIVAIAAPPIPGSVFAVLPIMMAGAGVSDSYYSLAVVIGTLLGYFCPVLNGYCMQLELLIVSAKLGVIDKSKLGIRK